MKWLKLLVAAAFIVGAGCGNDGEPDCRLNSDCPGDELCIEGKCLMECKTNKDCLPDGTCSGGYCLFLAGSNPASDTGSGEGTDATSLYCQWRNQKVIAGSDNAMFDWQLCEQEHLSWCKNHIGLARGECDDKVGFDKALECIAQLPLTGDTSDGHEACMGKTACYVESEMRSETMCPLGFDCMENGACTYYPALGWCAPATDVDCAGSCACKHMGHCKFNSDQSEPECIE